MSAVRCGPEWQYLVLLEEVDETVLQQDPYDLCIGGNDNSLVYIMTHIPLSIVFIHKLTSNTGSLPQAKQGIKVHILLLN